MSIRLALVTARRARVWMARAKRASRTSWGEESYVKVGSTLSNNAFSILDYRAPAGFGVVRHLHYREDEALHLVEGRIAVWMPDRCLTMTPGDLVFLPKGVEHAWRAPLAPTTNARDGELSAPPSDRSKLTMRSYASTIFWFQSSGLEGAGVMSKWMCQIMS
jgi:mannose-6-phosphate isomerase-like protein (cupin superfamily)